MKLTWGGEGGMQPAYCGCNSAAAACSTLHVSGQLMQPRMQCIPQLLFSQRRCLLRLQLGLPGVRQNSRGTTQSGPFQVCLLTVQGCG